MFAPFALTSAQAATVAYFTGLGVVFAGHIAGFRAVAPAFTAVLNRHAARIRAIAGATFSLYLFHMPVMLFMVAVSPWPPAAWPTRLAVIVVPLAACFALSAVTERRKDLWRALFERVFWASPAKVSPAPGAV
jgi:peptidoglycan/LPS O-acetylase OafA/YrhL